MRLLDGILHVSNALAVTLYIAAATNFVNYKNTSGDPEQQESGTLTFAP